MDDSPSQLDVDFLAHYVQAVTDLRSSPFFIDGQTTLGVSFSQRADGTKGPMTFRVPDPRVRDSLIVPFRRIWMTGEPANFERVANIIKRYWPEASPYVDFFKDELKKTKAHFPETRFMGLLGSADLSISPEDVIDLWLNCRLAHVGAKPGNSRVSRADFERELKTYGEAKFEYMFMTAIYHVGLWFINLVQLAERLLKRSSNEGLQPSFVFDTITLHGTRKTEIGDSLERHTPGVTIDDDDLVAKLKLMCRQKLYSEISKLIDMLHKPLAECVSLIQRENDLRGFLTRMGITTESTDAVNEHTPVSQFATISDDFTDLTKYPWRKGMIARVGDSRLLIAGEAYNILSEQFVLLREAFTCKSPVETTR